MKIPRFWFRPNFVAILALAVVSLAVVWMGHTRTHHIDCLVAIVGGENRIFLGNPGAVAAHKAVCEFRFLTASRRSFVQLRQHNVTSTLELTPWSDPGTISGVDPIPSPDGVALHCQVTQDNAVPGGSSSCQFGLWQLSPSSNGVVVRLQSGTAIISAYSLTPGTTPPHAHPVAW